MKAVSLVVLLVLVVSANAVLIPAEAYPDNRSIIWYVGEAHTLYFSFWNGSQVFEMDECRIGTTVLEMSFHSAPVAAPDGNQYYYTVPYTVPNDLGAQSISEHDIAVSCRKTTVKDLVQSLFYFAYTAERRPEGYDCSVNDDCASGVCGMQSRKCEKNLEYCEWTRSGDCVMKTGIPGIPNPSGQRCVSGDLTDACGTCGCPSSAVCEPRTQKCIPLKSGTCKTDADCPKDYYCHLVPYKDNECILNETVVNDYRNENASNGVSNTGGQTDTGGNAANPGGLCLMGVGAIAIFGLGIVAGKFLRRRK